MTNRHLPITLKTGLAAIPLALLFFVMAILQGGESPPSHVLLYLGICFSCLAIGEIINHPVQVDCNFTEDERSDLKRFHHRRRNPCPLGNLFTFAGLLFLFLALGDVISL